MESAVNCSDSCRAPVTEFAGGASLTMAAAIANDAAVEPSGIAALDAVLPGGGWPVAGLIELLLTRPGSGELTLLRPLLARNSRRRRWVAWVAPPLLPYAPGLAAAQIDPTRQLWVRTVNPTDALWAAEQLLASGSCAVVLLWPGKASYRQLRRLALACRRGNTLGVAFRSAAAGEQSTPARLRLALSASAGMGIGTGVGLCVEIRKASSSARLQRLFRPTTLTVSG